MSFGKVADAASAGHRRAWLRTQDWKLINKSVKAHRHSDTVMGEQRYGIDVQRGMLYAAIARCPVFGGKVRSSTRPGQGRRGIVKVLAIRASSRSSPTIGGAQALRDVHVEWDVSANSGVSSASLMEFTAGPRHPDGLCDLAQGRRFRPGLRVRAKRIEAEYYTPYLAHSCMEPMGCTALIKDGKVDVWTSTQNAEASLATAAATAGVPLENVEVNRVQLGGGFGRRGGAQDFVRQGVAIAKVMEGTPVKMLVTREEDTQHDFYRPASLIRVKAVWMIQVITTAWYSRVASTSVPGTLARVPLKRPFAPADGVDPQAVASLRPAVRFRT